MLKQHSTTSAHRTTTSRLLRDETLTLATVLVLAGLAGGVTLVAGCGGGGGGGGTAATPVPTTSPNATYANKSYSATNMVLVFVGTSSLTVNVASDGQSVSGVFTQASLASSSETASAAAARAKDSAKDATKSGSTASDKAATGTRQVGVSKTISLTGALVPSTGAFSISGTSTDASGNLFTLTITGTLPTPPATTGGSVVITIEGFKYGTNFGDSPSVTLLSGVSPTPPPTPTPTSTPTTAQYTATDIGSPGSGYQLTDYGGYGGSGASGPSGFDSESASINASGQVASTWIDASYVYHAFLYTPGSGFQDLGGITPAGTTYYGAFTGSYASGINDSGVVVGASYGINDESHAVLFSGGTVQDLGSLGGAPYQDAYSVAINASGQVAGISEASNNFSHAFLYSNRAMQDLGALSGSYNFSYANALNASGQVVGYSYTANDGEHAFLYSNGAMQDLGTLPGATNDYSYASGINASGQIVGYSYASGGSSHGFFYANGTMQNLDTLAGITDVNSFSSANSINDSGQIVGYDANASTQSTYGAFVYSNGVLQSLNDITSGLNGLTLYFADQISNNGTILAEAADSYDDFHLVVLTPISAETRAKHPVLVGEHARGVTRGRLPKWLLQRPPFTKAMPRRLHNPTS